MRNLFVVGTVALILWVCHAAKLWSGEVSIFQLGPMVRGLTIGCLGMGTWMYWSSRFGKVKEREQLLDFVPWRGDETVLDVGCGRGLVLIGAAKRLDKGGKAFGIDLWQEQDLSGNRPEAVLENARLEGVAERVEVKTADMRQIPFADATFDRVLSKDAIHNVYDKDGRATTMREIARVLKPGGTVVLCDIRHVRQYATELKGRGLIDVERVGFSVIGWIFEVLTLGRLTFATLRARKPG